MSAVERLTGTYGSFALDSTNGITLSSAYDKADTSVDGSFYIEFDVTPNFPITGNLAADDASWKTQKAAIETALRLPRKNLIVNLGASTVEELVFTTSVGHLTQTAIVVQPELRLLEENARWAHYGFRVRNQIPGNVPGNARRRESLTRKVGSLAARRTVTFTATWTSDETTGTAYARYQASALTFYAAYLPANAVDQYGTTGTWVLAQDDPQWNDENSLVTVSQTVFYEVFAGRRESLRGDEASIGAYRVAPITGTWCASSGYTALQNYVNNGGAFFDAALLDRPSSGRWVQVDERLAWNDAGTDASYGGTLTVTRIYHETFSGLREYVTDTTEDASRLRTVRLRGTYYDDSAAGGTTAVANYNAGINTLVTTVIGAVSPAIAHYESVSIPKVLRYDQNTKRLFFEWTLRELAYQQSGTSSPAWNDADVTLQKLDLSVDRPFEIGSITAANPVTNLLTGTARFSYAVNFQTNQDPATLWTSRLRDHVAYAIAYQLGPYVTSIHVTLENVGVSPDGNTLVGFLRFVVVGVVTVVKCQILQRVTQIPGRRFVDRGDGDPYHAYPYRKPPKKRLFRRGYMQYVLGVGTPTLFAVGDNVVSGFTTINTGKTAQESIDDQNADGTMTVNSTGWYIDPDAPEPLANTDLPQTMGDGTGLQLVEHVQEEHWIYFAALEPGSSR